MAAMQFLRCTITFGLIILLLTKSRDNSLGFRIRRVLTPPPVNPRSYVRHILLPCPDIIKRCLPDPPPPAGIVVSAIVKNPNICHPRARRRCWSRDRCDGSYLAIAGYPKRKKPPRRMASRENLSAMLRGQKICPDGVKRLPEVAPEPFLATLIPYRIHAVR